MPRKTLRPEERRKTISFTLAGTDIKELDDFIIKEAQKNPYSVVSRQTILEGLLRDFLNHKKAAK